VDTAPTWNHHSDLATRITPAVGRAEYLDHLAFRSNARPMFTELFGPMVGLKEEWHAQGATPAELDFSAFRYRGPERAFIPVSIGRLGGTHEVTLQDSPSHRTWRDSLGRTMMLTKGYSTTGLPLTFPVRTMPDWLRIRRLYTYSPARHDGDWEAFSRRARQRDQVLTVEIPGAFDEPRELMGATALCHTFYDDPALIHDMIETFTDTALRVLDLVSSRVRIDVLYVHEDLAGSRGPLIGPKLFKAFIAPYYRRVWDLLRKRGTVLFDLESDGNVRPLLPAMLDAGVNCLHPVEPVPGMDLLDLRRHYRKELALYGGIDKHVLRRSRQEIDTELERKLPPMIASGGHIIALDHRIPNQTPLDHYRHYVNKVWEIMERETR